MDQILDLLGWWTRELRAAIYLVRWTTRRASETQCIEKSSSILKYSLAQYSGSRGWDARDRKEAPVFVGRSIALPPLSRMIPFSRALEVGRSTVLETTPFNLDAVYVIPIEDDIILRISVVVIKRDVLNDFLDTTAAEFIKPETLGICIGGRVISLPSRALENLHHVFAHLKRRKQMLTIIFAAALIALSITYTQLALRYSAAEDQLENIVEAKRGEALQVRKLFDQQQKTLASIEAARQGKDQAVSLVRLWEEATRTVPDDAWITDLNFDGQTVTMSGFASRSASLIGDLGASPFFKDPTFTSPVVRVPGKAGERFELRAQVTRP